MDVEQLVNDFLYLNYRYNRDRSPDISPQKWRLVYGDKADQFEMWYQIDHIISHA